MSTETVSSPSQAPLLVTPSDHSQHHRRYDSQHTSHNLVVPDFVFPSQPSSRQSFKSTTMSFSAPCKSTTTSSTAKERAVSNSHSPPTMCIGSAGSSNNSDSQCKNKPRSPERRHAHRRSAAISHDFLAEIKQNGGFSFPQVQPPLPPSSAPSMPLNMPPDSPQNRSSPCPSSPASPSLSSASSLVSLSSTSTSPPIKAKVAFSPSVEFIPSHSTTTSTSTTTTITPNSPVGGPPTPTFPIGNNINTESRSGRSKNNNHKKVKSWSFMRPFRGLRSSIIDDIADEEEDDDFDNDELIPAPRPATPPRSYAKSQYAAPEPMIDLDAALGPAGTPPLLSHSRFPSAERHRRTESAPDVMFTKSVDFKTFSESISVAFPLPPPSSRGRSRKMLAVAEIDEDIEEVDESIHSDSEELCMNEFVPIDEEIKQSSSEYAIFEENTANKENQRQSIWMEFVKSFGNVSTAEESEGKVSNSQVYLSNASPKSTDDISIILGEPGPEVRSAIEPNLRNSISVSTLSESSSVNISDISGQSSSKQSRIKNGFKRHNKRHSVAMNLRNSMFRSQSVGDLLSDNLKEKRRLSLSKNENAWRSQGNLASESLNCNELDLKLMQSTPKTQVFTQGRIKSNKTRKSIAGKVWEWVRGIVS
ncbi:hypothetical protein V1511DRAFT_509198 [Dipodascopsis uninucleata]